MSLLSDRWHEASALRPRWRLSVRVDRQSIRGEPWYLLSDAVHGRATRLDAAAYAIVARCDGRVTLQEIWHHLLANDPERVPSQDQMMDLIATLVIEGYLECDQADAAALLERERRTRSREQRQKLNPLALRIGLIDPSRWLMRSGRLDRWVFGVPGALFASVWVVAALAILIDAGDRLWVDLKHPLGSTSAWLIGVLCFIAMKAIHEASHALAVKRFGGMVHEAGIGLLMFLPAPYVDASQASRFSDPRERALVGAAGVLAELVIAAAGVVLWRFSEPGLLHQLGLSCALIGGVSTFLFNANPLTRMDGYHIATDLLQLPNLASRSARFWSETALRRLLGVAVDAPMPVAAGERRWLWIYAPLSWMYRIALCAWLVHWLGSYYAPAATLCGLVLLHTILVAPLWRLRESAERQSFGLRGIRRVRWRMGFALVLVAGLLIGVPLPDRVIASGVVWVPEQAQLRAGDDGFVAEVLHADGTTVLADEPVLAMSEAELEHQALRLQARREGLEATRLRGLLDDPARSIRAAQSLLQVDEQLTRVSERLDSLELRSPLAGRLSLGQADDLPGRFFKRGELIGAVLDAAPAVIRVVLPQDQLTRLSGGVTAVTIGFAREPLRSHGAELLRTTPAAVSQLPSPSLGTAGGGPIEVDPADKDRVKPLLPTFVVDVQLREPAAGHPGERVEVVFDCGWMPLAAQGARALRQVFRGQFAPESV